MSDYRNFRDERRERWREQFDRQGGHNHVWTGLFLLVIGGVALAKSFGVPMPIWLFTWQMLLITIGVFIGLKKNFREGGWFVPILVGGAFLVNDYFLEGDLRKHIWPLILICLGVLFIFRPRKRKGWKNWSEKKNGPAQGTGITQDNDVHFTEDDFIDSTCIFSGSKKMILSKNFKGGDMTAIFGGCEVDLTQADMTQPAVLDVTAIFGGATLVIPSHWAVKSEAVTIFGGIGDKRKFPSVSDTTTKTLIVKGTIIFGGIEIKSY